MAKHKHVAKEFPGLNPEQMKACGGKPMPVDANGRKLEGQPFGDWVSAQVREYRSAQSAALASAEVALRRSLEEAERMVELYAEQIDRNIARQEDLLRKPRV